MTTAPVVRQQHTDTTTPAVVLKFDQNVMHHGGLGAIRSLGRLGVPVYGVHERRWAPAAGSRYLSGRWFWRADPSDVDRVRTGLGQLADQLGRPAVLIPTDDAASIFLAEHGDSLRSSFLFPEPPAALPRTVAGKFSMYRLCRELGVATPEAIVPSTSDELADFIDRVGFPVIAKLVSPWHGGGTLRSTAIVDNNTELTAIRQAAEAAGVDVMWQEYIVGGPNRDWFFHGYCDRDSVCRPAFTGVKRRSYPPHAGLTSLGAAEPNEPLRDIAVTLLSAVGYRGIVDMDFRFDARTGRYLLLDFNPRLGAQFRLFQDTGGVDVVVAQYLDLTGQPIPTAEQRSGRTFLVESYDPIAALGYWRSGELTLRSWLTSLRGHRETAWFAPDDLVPFGLMCARMGWRAISAPFGRRVSTTDDSDPRYLPGRTRETVA